jgi:hypothetical protein
MIEGITDGYLQQAKASSSDERVEARDQIERMWYIAVPALLKNLSSREPGVAELAVKSLILMRNESIVRSLIDIAKTTQDEQTKAVIIFALKKMSEQRKSLIPGRECLDAEQSKVLFDHLVSPALKDLENKQTP